MDTKKLRQKILDLAIHGKLVPQDPNDEPAIELLKRINPKFEASENEQYDIVPLNWALAKVEDFGDLLSGRDLANEVCNNESKGIPYLIGASNIEGNTFSFVRWTEHPQVVSIYGDMLITCKGTIGTVIKNNIGKMHIARQFMAIRPKDNCISSDYLRICLLALIEKIKKDARGVIPGISRDDILEKTFPLPPFAEQKRIVTAIEQWFALIDILENEKSDLQASIQQAKSKILDLAIHGKLVPQDPNDEPAIELLKRINPKFEACDNELDTTQLPDSWCWTTLGSLFNHNTGKALNKSDLQEGSLLPYITTSNVYWNCFNLSEIKKMFFKDSEIDKCTVTKGDLLVCEGGDIGRSAIWGYDYDICIQNHIHRLRAKGDVSHLLYLYVLMFYKWTDKIRGKGIGLQGLSSGLLDKMVVPLPPYQEQLRIVAKIEELFAILDSIKESLE